MSAYLLVLFALATRVVPHPDWFSFTAVGGSLLYFGARRPLRQIAIPVLLLMGTDYYLTAIAYGYPFHLQGYLLSWAWYAAIPVLGALMLRNQASAGRIVGASAVSATSFFVLSNFAVWATFESYPHTLAGLTACYAAGIPFYRNDLIATVLVTGLAFGLPALVRRMQHSQDAPGRMAM